MIQRITGYLVLILLCTVLAANAAGIELAVGGWIQSPTGTVGYKALSANDIIDIEKDLKYDDETRLMGRAKIDMPLFLPNIYLMAAPIQFDGNGRKDVQFKFGDQTFNANVDFFSDIQMDQYDVGLYYGLPFLRTLTAEHLNIDLGLNARILDISAEIRQDASGIQEKETATIAVPTVYAAAQLQLTKWLALEAEGRGIAYSGDSLYSLIGRVRVKVVGPLWVAGGYRYEKLDIDEDDVIIDMEIGGPFLEAVLKF